MLIWLIAGAVTFADFEFLEGNWCGDALGGEVIERWDAPFGDAMTGSMTVVKDEVVTFHEFFVIVREEGRWLLRLKHFGPDMVSWEEREEVVQFPLQEVAPLRIRFEGLSFERLDEAEGPDNLKVVVDGGKLVFDYRRC
ncbi:MAG: DUF6265 family protein [Gammaproteobacteria bacterium]|nr:DUF6265 family protein [Gammaproteobacteria bacterium]